MPTVSEQLRTARESKNLTLKQVAEFTKLKSDQVEALETGNYASFPAPVYIRGSIRTYAKLLKLDVPQLMTQLDEEFAHSRELSDPPPLTPQSHGIVDWITLQFSKLDWRIAAGLAMVLVGLVVAWSMLRPAPRTQKADPLSSLGSGVHKPRSIPGRGEFLPLPTNAPTR
jgi:cytoskeletal protein RodZ